VGTLYLPLLVNVAGPPENHNEAQEAPGHLPKVLSLFFFVFQENVGPHISSWINFFVSNVIIWFRLIFRDVKSSSGYCGSAYLASIL
jgi:hypothetical protein